MSARLILFVSDQGAARDLFTAVLQTPPRLDVPGMTELALPGGAVLGLMPEAGIRRLLGDALPDPAASRPPRAELYLHVDDPAAYHARALAAGARELSPLAPRSWGDVAAYSLGPDGHVLAFAASARDGRGGAAVEGAVEVAPAAEADHPACERILRALPDWFGIEEAIVGYVRRLPALDVRVARENGEVVGFVGVERHGAHAAELHVMAVAPNRHRRGIGRRLVAAAERELRGAGVAYLQVKTLSPSREDAGYAATRRFYQALGFVPLEEHPTLWGPSNPCLQMVKRL